MERRVVVTGLGIIGSLGNDVNTFWEETKKGTCGVDFITYFDTEKFKCKVAAEVKNFDPLTIMDNREAKRTDKYCQFALSAATEAVTDSGIDLEKIDKERFGVIISSGIGGLSTIEKEHKTLLEKGPNRVSPLFIPMIISNMASGNVAIKFGAKGPCSNVVTACATGTNSIGEAFRMIKDNLGDLFLAGGAEATITPLAIAGFSSLTALSSSTDPERASIPFDADRNGFVMGEGSGVVMLEEYEHAIKRGAKIYAEVVGYGQSCDAYHITSPSPDGEGAARAMKQAIEVAGINCEEISYINAHGTGTKANDKFETEGIKAVFGDYASKIPVSSTKSMTGHLLGAAGAIEAVISVKAIQDGVIPPTIGYKNPDPECDLDCVPNQSRKADLKYVMSNSLGFGGHNAVLVFKKHETNN